MLICGPHSRSIFTERFRQPQWAKCFGGLSVAAFYAHCSHT